jgi:predicted ferric reductase
LLDLHRFLGGLGVTFLLTHLATIVADSFVHFGRADLLVPFASSWKPASVALGVFAFYLVTAVELSSLALRKLSRRWWRRIHMASFAGFILATGHGITAGTDSQNVWMFGAYAAVAALVVFLTVFRVLTLRPKSPRPMLVRTARSRAA